MLGVPGVNRSMSHAFSATTPGRLEMPTTVQVSDDGQFIGELSDDQLTADEIAAEQRANHELYLAVTDALNARSKQLHALMMSRLAVPFEMTA